MLVLPSISLKSPYGTKSFKFCVSSNGCKVPTFNMSHSGTVSNMNHGPFEASNDSCFRNALETCVQQNFSLFKLPSFHGFEGEIHLITLLSYCLPSHSCKLKFAFISGGFPNMGSANNFQRRDVIVDSGKEYVEENK